MRVVTRAVLLWAVATSACHDEPAPPPAAECAGEAYTPYVQPILLSEFPAQKLAISVVLGALDGPQERTIVVELHYTDTLFGHWPAALHDGDHDYCPEFDPSFTVSLDGAEASGMAGAWVCPGPGGEVCTYPRAELAVSTDHTADGVLTISDRSRSITIPLGDMLLERTATPVGTTDWTFHANQAVAFTWSPSDDLSRYTGAVGGVVQADGTLVSLDSVTQTPDELRTTMPDLVGTGTLGFELTRVEDAAGYSITTTQVARHDVSIVR